MTANERSCYTSTILKSASFDPKTGIATVSFEAGHSNAYRCGRDNWVSFMAAPDAYAAFLVYIAPHAIN